MTKLTSATGCILFLLIMNACFTHSSSSKKQDEMNVSFEQRLIELGYQKLFLSSSDEELNAIWEEGANRSALLAIIASEASRPIGKFLAAEVIYFFGQIPDESNFPALAIAYAFALKNTSFDKNNTVGLNGNLWGFLYKLDDTGHLGQRFVQYGDEAIVPLKKLLYDNDGILYEGSREATMGNAYQYRVKDFSAFYLHKITGIPIQFHQDLDKRDQEVEKFKAELDKYRNG